jgi:Holliday junction resolvasome RuvABC endonuclease subunit
MILLGLDIASYKTGFFIMDIENIRYKIGLIEAKGSLEERIRIIHKKFKKIYEDYQPSIIVIENTYLDEQRKHKFGKKRGNLNTLKVLEKCHGAIISATDELTDIFYLNPSEHKEMMTGLGNADKKKTIWAIQKKLGLSNLGNDEADAAALIFTYLMKRERWEILKQFAKKYE